MQSWLISIVGIVFLGVIVDLLYPNGKTAIICKSVFGIMVIIVIMNPIFKLKNLDTNDNFSADLSVLSSVNTAKADSLEIYIVNKLIEKGIDGVGVEIETNLYNIEFEIENIYVDIVNLVLTENLTNINKYEVITNEICNITQIDKERILFYG